MKKLVLLIFLLLVAIHVATPISAAEYEIPEGNLTITVPDDYYVFTRNMPEDDPIFADTGITSEDITRELAANSSYLCCYDIDSDFYCYLVVFENSETQKYYNMQFWDLSSNLNNTRFSPIDFDLYKEITNAAINENAYNVIEHQQTPFIQMGYTYEHNGKPLSLLVGYTLINGQCIYLLIPAITEDAKIPGYISKLNELVSGISFTVNNPNPGTNAQTAAQQESNKGSILEVGLSGAIQGAILAVIATVAGILYYRWHRRKNQQKEDNQE